MNPKIAIIGAGCSGIAAIKYLKDAGLVNLVCYEQNNAIGGNWLFNDKSNHSSICETTHIISSKKLSAYPGFEMPENYPDYPSHRQLLKYFNDFVDTYKLSDFIRFNTKVQAIEKQNNEQWLITDHNGESEIFDFLILANGHHSVPRMPSLPGNFSGKLIHAHDYKSNREFEGQDVLVVGGGNSACDCAVEISRVAKKTAISMRRPHYIIPKFFMGVPTDMFNERSLWIPKFIRDWAFKYLLKFQIGKYEDYGLETPNFPITRDHPTLNSELLYKLRHGNILPKKGIKLISGTNVSFTDGSSEEFDTIVAATGYKISTPFFSSDFLDYSEADEVPLLHRIFHPRHQSLFFLGLLQPQGAIWPLSALQSQLIARYIKGAFKLPPNVEALAQKEAEQITRQFLKSKRHTIEVDFHAYSKKIRKLIHG